MSIPVVPAAIAAGASATGTTVPAAATRQVAAPHEVVIDQFTQQPVPPRFPWLSRLSQQLESASGQRFPFDPAPVLGDHVDRAA